MRYLFASFAVAAALVATTTYLARAQGIDEGRALVRDAGPEPLAAVAPVHDDAPPDDSSPGVVDHVLDVAGPLGRGALGGIACLAVAWLLARCRERWGWLRRGWAGNAAATGYAALATFGGVLAVGGSVGAGLTAVGGAMAAGMAIARDPGTARLPGVSASEDAPT